MVGTSLLLTGLLGFSAADADSYSASQDGTSGIIFVAPGLFSAGVSFCAPAAEGTPAECPGPGGFIFDASHFDGAGHGEAQVAGTCTVSKTQSLPGDLFFFCAADRDDDSLITSVDPMDDDGTHDHGTNANGYDDHFYTGSVGSLEFSTTLDVCFAHDTTGAGHDWDDLVILVGTPGSGAPYVGSVEVSFDLDDSEMC